MATRRLAIVAGGLAALVVIGFYLVRPVPDRVVSLLGGPRGGVDRIGGARIRYRPAAGVDAAEVAARLHSRVKRDGDILVLDFPGFAEGQIADLLPVLGEGGLEMREVLETNLGGELARFAAAGVSLEIDQWLPEAGGARHEVSYLLARTEPPGTIDDARARDALQRTIADAAAHGVGPQGSEVMFERVEAADSWRTYEVAREVLIDGDMIESARVSYDPNTNRPIVLLDFTREGGARFCEATGRLVGHKIATVLGGRVRSAPIINSKICGGRASITMGGADAAKQEREASVLAAVLAQGALPRGGHVEDARWQPPASVAVQEWLGRLLLGLCAGLLFGGLVAAALRFAKPSWRPALPPIAGGFPYRRLAVTALAPITLLVGGHFTLPHVNEYEFMHVIRSGDTTMVSVFALGIAPLMTSFVVVELIALAIPRLRWRRHDPLGRIRLGQAVAATAILVALVQGYFIAVYLESLSRGGAELVAAPGMSFRLLTMVTLAAGTTLLAVVAGMISVHGLGNGYGALLVSSWGLAIVRPLIDEPAMSVAWLDRERLFGLALLAVIAILTWALLRSRISGREREVALRLPLSSIAPINDAGGLAYLVITLSALGLGAHLFDVMGWLAEVSARKGIYFLMVVAFVPVWAWLLARPAVLERVALQASLLPPTRAAWARATVLSAVVLASIAGLGLLARSLGREAVALADPVMAMIATAVILDLIEDARAHREPMVVAGVLHQIQRAGIVERVLGDAGIRYSIQASNLRALFAFFGPWAPAVVLVPVADAQTARTKLDDVLRESRTTLPRAAVRDEPA